MARTITVKGIGKATVKPDQIELRLHFEAKDKSYERALELAAQQLNDLRRTFKDAGFRKDAVKTTTFDIQTIYDRIKDKNQNYISVFDGYECTNGVKVVIDFTMQNLSAAIGAVAQSGVNPRMDLEFTVKNPAAVSEQILKDAADNARKKAEILCTAAGVKLGNLLDINYNWGEVSFYSETRYDVKGCSLAPCSMEIEPDDIQAGDSATFVWEII